MTTVAENVKKVSLTRWMNLMARVITGLWAGFWIFFAVASSVDEFNSRGSASLGGLLFPLLFTVVILLLALTAWKWVSAGRIALPLTGVTVFVLYPFISDNFPVTTGTFVIITLGLPPLSAGILLITLWRLNRVLSPGREAEV
jgi:hypothetical protein